MVNKHLDNLTLAISSLTMSSLAISSLTSCHRHLAAWQAAAYGHGGVTAASNPILVHSGSGRAQVREVGVKGCSVVCILWGVEHLVRDTVVISVVVRRGQTGLCDFWQAHVQRDNASFYRGRLAWQSG